MSKTVKGQTKNSATNLTIKCCLIWTSSLSKSQIIPTGFYLVLFEHFKHLHLCRIDTTLSDKVKSAVYFGPEIIYVHFKTVFAIFCPPFSPLHTPQQITQ